MDVQRLQVLVVAADPAVMATVGEILSEANVGADLLHAEGPERALGFLHPANAGEETARPDAMLLDADLDDGAVAALFDRLAADPDFSRLPIVAVARDPDAAAARLAGRRIHALVGKPPTRDELLRVLSYFDEA
jgi:CheY-like chemotaxis protein